MDTFTINYDINAVATAKEEKKKTRRRKKALPFPFQPLSQQKLNDELDSETNVELESTMWKVMRSKPALNNYLKMYSTEKVTDRHALQVGNVIKFGRVNFKVCALRCEGRLPEDVQGGYYLLQKKNQEVISQMEKIQQLKTEKSMEMLSKSIANDERRFRNMLNKD
mmetsp:Transcript_18780/g.28913  ORF Transcript_18780/g.28913 Transcript_18780/m.28913 type:complete len:166 (+) Transcript_18780:726-1223(+)